MWSTFWLQNFHFALEVFIGLASFVAAWLHIDAWGVKKEAKTMVRALGFIALAAWSIINATSSEFVWLQSIEIIVKFLGLLFLLLSYVMDPVPEVPPETKVNGNNSKRGATRSVVRAIAVPTVITSSFFFQPAIYSTILLFIIAYQIFRRATKGMIKEWRWLVVVFYLLTLSEALTIFYFWRGSSNIIVAQLLQPYGPAWFIEHGVKALAFFILARWAWGYIRFRLVPQLFVHHITIIFVIFVTTTLAFTTILLHNVEKDQLAQLKVSVQTLDYAFNELENSAVLASKIAAENGGVRDALAVNDMDKLFTITNRLMLENDTDFFTTVSTGGDVLMRAEDRGRVGDSLSSDVVVSRAMKQGESMVSLAQQEGIVAPQLSIRAASPVYSTTGELIGAVVTGYFIDNAFVDKIKKVTGLDVTVFGNNIRSATTLFTPGTTSRDIGIAEINDKVLDTVISKGETFTGTVQILNTPFYTAYAPLVNLENNVIGMFSIGRQQLELINVTNRTIQLTFLISVLLMVIAIVPVYLVTRYIVRYQKV